MEARLDSSRQARAGGGSGGNPRRGSTATGIVLTVLLSTSVQSLSFRPAARGFAGWCGGVGHETRVGRKPVPPIPIVLCTVQRFCRQVFLCLFRLVFDEQQALLGVLRACRTDSIASGRNLW